MDIQVPASLGELLDKITILEIKSARIADAGKRANVDAELAALSATYAGIAALDAEKRCALTAPIAALKAINEQLWEIEDEIRLCEKAARFDARFIELARAVYQTNDERSRVKREINLGFGSRFVEEKSYA